MSKYFKALWAWFSPDAGPLVNHERRPNDQRLVLLHGHIFKNAGTTFDWALKRNFADDFLDHRDDRAMKDGRSDYMAQILNDVPSLKALSTHHLYADLPVMDNTRLLAIYFLRHPIERVASVYQFERRQVEDDLTPGATHAKKLDFEAYVKWRLDPTVGNTIRNFQVRYCSGIYKDLESRGALDAAKKSLEASPLIGVVDRYDQSMVVFEEYLRDYYPQIDLAYIQKNVTNANRKDERSTDDKAKSILSQLNDLAGQLLEENHLDVQLYMFANELLDARIAQLDNFEEKLEAFQLRCKALQ